MERRAEYDILKAIGILSVVMGHCVPFPTVVQLVYSYHLALFFFVAGMQYNEQRYALQPFAFMQNRGRSLWKSYFFYSVLFVVTHNIAVRYAMLENGKMYSLWDGILSVWGGMIFSCAETLSGALWFVPMMFFGMMLFAGCMWLAYRLPAKLAVPGAICLGVLVAWVGVTVNLQGTYLLYHTQTSLLLMPVMTVGWLVNRSGVRLEKMFRWYAAIPCVVLWAWLVLEKDFTVELSQGQIAGGWMFFIVTACGLYVMCSLAVLLARWKAASRFLCWIGRHSFDIMALHFAVFKVVDVVFGRLQGDEAVAFARFPAAYAQRLWPVYVLLGCLLPPLLRTGAGWLCEQCRRLGVEKTKELV